MIGSNHGDLAAALVPELLSTHPFFMTSEPDVDDPACILPSQQLVLTYCTHEFWLGKNWRIMSYSPKFLSPIFKDTPRMYLGYALTSLFANFYLYGSPKFSHV